MTEVSGLSEQAVAAWNERRLDDFYALFEPDVTYHGPAGETLTGVEALRERYDAALAWCPDLRITASLVVSDPASRLLASMQREEGTAVDGTPFGFEGMTFFRLSPSGRVAEAWEQVRFLGTPPAA